MNDSFKSAEELDRLLHRALRELPARRAPLSLEMRVIQELQQRSVPWWRRSYPHWPASARGAFVAICGALVGLAALAGSQIAAFSAHWWPPISMSVNGPIQALMSIRALASMSQSIPPLWLMTGLGVAAFLYAALFGLGITAYRTLYLRL